MKVPSSLGRFWGLIAALAIQAGAVVHAQTDPFAAYLSSVPPVVQVLSTQNSGSGSTAITTKKFTFRSRGGANVIYALMTYPQAGGTYPAIMMNHGGGGYADLWTPTLQSYAAQGYVGIACDLPSICSKTSTPNSTGAWKSRPDSDQFNVTGGAQNSTLSDGVIAALECFNYLRAQANVDPTRIGIAGSSWGGYMTTMLAGLQGSKVKAAYSTYGCGFYDVGSVWEATVNKMSAANRSAWLTYLDAGRRAPQITAPYFIEEPANDSYFWPEAVAQTLGAIPSTKNLICMPNVDHQVAPGLPSMRQMYLDYHLKGQGQPFGSIGVTSLALQGDGSLQVNLAITLPAGIAVSAVQLYTSVPTGNWPSRTWSALTASGIGGNLYRATVPASLVTQNANFFANLTDARGVQTSSVVHTFPRNGGTYHFLCQRSGKALDNAGSVTDGSTVNQWTDVLPKTNQEWKLANAGGGYFTLACSTGGKVLDNNGSTTDGTPCVQRTPQAGNSNQSWRINYVGNGYYHLVCLRSGKALDNGGSLADGSVVNQWTDQGAANKNQNWMPKFIR